METLPLRLPPGGDLRLSLQTLVRERGLGAAFVLAGIGSLAVAHLRLADAAQAQVLPGPWEILTLSGSIGVDGAHLHMAMADAQGRVLGGHVAAGCIVHTTSEILLALLPEWQFSRRPDAATGYAELHIEAPGKPTAKRNSSG